MCAVFSDMEEGGDKGGWALCRYIQRKQQALFPYWTLTCAAFSLNLKDNSGPLRQHDGRRERWIPSCCTSRLTHTHKLITYNSVLQIVPSDFLGGLSSIHIIPVPLPLSAMQAGQRSNREDVRNCDSKLRETALIRAALWLHTALFTLVSLTHSCPIVTKHGEASGSLFLTSSMAHC